MIATAMQAPRYTQANGFVDISVTSPGTDNLGDIGFVLGLTAYSSPSDRATNDINSCGIYPIPSDVNDTGI